MGIAAQVDEACGIQYLVLLTGHRRRALVCQLIHPVQQLFFLNIFSRTKSRVDVPVKQNALRGNVKTAAKLPQGPSQSSFQIFGNRCDLVVADDAHMQPAQVGGLVAGCWAGQQVMVASAGFQSS